MMDEIGKKFSVLADKLSEDKTKKQRKEVVIYLLLFLLFVSFAVVAIQKLVSQDKEIKRLAGQTPIVLYDTIYIKVDSARLFNQVTENPPMQLAKRNTSITFDTKQLPLYYSIEAREAPVLDSIQEIRYFSADNSLDRQTLITNDRNNKFFQEWKTPRSPLPITITILYKDGRIEIDNITK